MSQNIDVIQDTNEQDEPQIFTIGRKGHGITVNRRQFIELAAASAVVATVTGCSSGNEETNTPTQRVPNASATPTRRPSADNTVPPS